MDPDLPLPYLRIQNGYELKLEVPKKTKFFKVYLFKEYFDDTKLEMVVQKKPTASIHLSGKKLKQLILHEKDNWPAGPSKVLPLQRKGLIETRYARIS